MKYEYKFLYFVWVQFSGEIDFRKVSYLHNTSIWIWIIAVNHPKTSKFNKAFEFSVISSYYSYNNMFLLVSHYPFFLITSCIHTFEKCVQSIVLYDLRYAPTYPFYDGVLKWIYFAVFLHFNISKMAIFGAL